MKRERPILPNMLDYDVKWKITRRGEELCHGTNEFHGMSKDEIESVLNQDIVIVAKILLFVPTVLAVGSQLEYTIEDHYKNLLQEVHAE